MPRDIVPILHIYNGAPEYEPALTKEDFAGASDAMGQVMVGNTRENIVAARDFVIDNIHMNDIDPIHLGYLRATPAEVWATGCGTATEKAALLAAILNHGGYAAHVTGEDWTTVGVMVDTLEYRLDIRHKTPMLLAGEAKDEVKSTNDTRTLDAAPYLDTLENGFHTLRAFQPIAGEPTVNAGRLALRRATPLATQACDLACDHTYTLPKGLKMVGNPIAIKLSHEGVGSVEISVKQSGKKLRVVRKLKLEKSMVPVEEYAQYRELLAAWQSYNANSTVLLRKK
jgi:hypothetical protein